jgi:BASS family bile acid:Na+ symporter
MAAVAVCLHVLRRSLDSSAAGTHMTLQQAILLALKASIVMTVFAFGLRASAGDVVQVLRRPSLLARSLLAMLVVMPVIAVTIVRLFALRPSVEIALVALAIAPIPPLLPGKELKAGGQASYALGLMVIVGVLSIVTVPPLVSILSRYFMRPFAMSFGAIAKIVLVSIVLPTAAGLAVRAAWPALAGRIARPVTIAAKALLAAAALAMLIAALPPTFALIGNGSVLALAAFVVVGLAAGHWLGGPDPDERVVLACSTASRHPAIALAVARANFPDEPHLPATILLYLLLTLLIEALYLARRRHHPAPLASPHW